MHFITVHLSASLFMRKCRLHPIALCANMTLNKTKSQVFKMKRKFTTVLCLVLLLILCCLTACGGQNDSDEPKPKQIVCISFPEYDWTRNLLGENPAGMEILLLINNGVDVHSYQPTVEDVAAITDCDLLVCSGGVSEQWVRDAWENNKRGAMVDMMQTLSSQLVQEELVEGMTPESGEHAHEHETKHEHAEDVEFDEHVWLSLRNAQTVCQAITEQLCTLDAANEEEYRGNLSAYQQKLSELDTRYTEVFSAAPLHTILVADRFPFRYLVQDYTLDYYAAFAGCSAETDASFETVLFLADKLSALDLPCVLILTGSDARIAEAVLANSRDADREVLSIDPLQSVQQSQIDEGFDYLSAMEQNFENLAMALGSETESR